MAREYPAAEERRRTADRARAELEDLARRSAAGDRRTAEGRGGRRRAGRAPAGRRNLRSHGEEPRIVLVGGVSGVHDARSHARRPALHHSAWTARNGGQLQDARRAPEHAAERLQAVPEFSPKARMPRAVRALPLRGAAAARTAG